jgi:hypothetical protein
MCQRSGCGRSRKALQRSDQHVVRSAAPVPFRHNNPKPIWFRRGGPGTAYDATTAYLKWNKGSQPPTQVLVFSHQYATMNLKMEWVTPTHLEVTYGESGRPGNHVSLDLQVVKCAGIDISVRHFQVRRTLHIKHREKAGKLDSRSNLAVPLRRSIQSRGKRCLRSTPLAYGSRAGSGIEESSRRELGSSQEFRLPSCGLPHLGIPLPPPTNPRFPRVTPD